MLKKDAQLCRPLKLLARKYALEEGPAFVSLKEGIFRFC
jgi:hypothetical protein